MALAGGGRLKANAHIRAEAVDGRTVHRSLHAQAPLALRRVDDGRVLFVSSAAHPVGGDELRLRIEVGPGASICLGSVAAMLVWPGASGEWSRFVIDAEVGAGGRLSVVPEPTVAVEGCRHRTEVAVTLGADAALRWRDDVVLGRSGEEPGLLESTIRVVRDGEPVLATGTRVGGDTVAWSGPAVTAGRRRLVTDTWVGEWGDASGCDTTAADSDDLVARHEPAPGVVVVSQLRQPVRRPN